MLYDLLNVFGKYFQDDKVIIDTYKLPDGYYYVFDENNNFEKMQIIKGESDNYDLEQYIKIRDFYSKYISSNKAIDTNYVEEIDNKKYSMFKKICSNNIYTLFFKNKSVLGLCNKDATKDAVTIDVFKNGVKKYYDSLKQLGSNKKEEILVKERYSDGEIAKNKEKMLDAFEKVYKDLYEEELPKETWIKIFFKEDINEYKRVSNIYIKIKLFNTNDNNIKIDEKVYGANNYNFGLNSKKPYLELKSTPFKVGSFISENDIDLLNKMYIWLYNNSAGKDMLKLPSDWKFYGTPKEEENINGKNTFIMKVAGNNGNARIDDYRYISKYNTKIRKFCCKDYIKKQNTILFETENVYELRKYTSNVWFAENEESKKDYIKDAYNDYEKRISKAILSNWKKELLKQYNSIFLELFEEEDYKNFITKLDNLSIEIIEKMYVENMLKNKNYKDNPQKAYNLWIAYKQYFNENGDDEGMKINNLQKECEEIVNKTRKLETDKQYYFLAGQVVYYLLTQSRTEKLTQDVTEPFLKANTVNKLKEEIKFLYEKYNYNIYLNYPAFNNILSEIFLQEPETKVKDNKQILLAGLLADNLFYGKKED